MATDTTMTRVVNPPSQTLGTKQVSRNTAFQFSQFIGGSNENRVDRCDAASHVIRRIKPQDRFSDDHAHAIEHTAEEQRGAGKIKVFGESKDDHAQAESKDTAEKDFSGVSARWESDTHHGAGQSSQHRGRAECAEPDRAYVQDVFGIEREHRNRTAEENGKKIEHHRAPQDLTPQNIPPSGGNRFEHRLVLGRLRGGWSRSTRQGFCTDFRNEYQGSSCEGDAA